jgi:hypothetical protein
MIRKAINNLDKLLSLFGVNRADLRAGVIETEKSGHVRHV